MTTATKRAEKQLVVFNLGSEAYGVDISAVREIIRMQDITKVPRTPDFIEGVINLRGRVVPVVDLRKRFNLPSAQQSKDSRVVVVDIGAQDLGMIVDSVTEVLRVHDDAVEPLSDVITTSGPDYILGIAKLEKRLVILLDLQQVLSKAAKASLPDTSDAR